MVTRQRKSKDKVRSTKVVWRISAAAPLGEYVHPEPEAVAEAPAKAMTHPKAEEGPLEIPERSWHRSSLELVDGMDMSEEPLDTLPDDLFDQFVKRVP